MGDNGRGVDDALFVRASELVSIVLSFCGGREGGGGIRVVSVSFDLGPESDKPQQSLCTARAFVCAY